MLQAHRYAQLIDVATFWAARVLSVILLSAFAHQAKGQSLSIFDVDATNFPKMRAKFFAFDAAGKPQQPSRGEVTLTENGVARRVTILDCPPPAPPRAISAVLVTDVSGSMALGGPTKNIELAKSAAGVWVNRLPLGISECAITSFDHDNYLNQDFTTDKARLLSAISRLQPQGDTDYDAALITPMAGALQVSKNGKYKKVIVLITDGIGGGIEAPIIAAAVEQNCTIYCITLGMPAPSILKNIARQTGGLTFESVTTSADADDAYSRILLVAQEMLPCDIEWTSEPPCDAGVASAELTWQTATARFDYMMPTSSISLLRAVPSFVDFGRLARSNQSDATITLTALNADYTVTGVRRRFGSPDFSVVNASFPLTIPRNTSQTITLRFLPTDSSLKYASFVIETDGCDNYFSATGGFPGRKSPTSSLRLISPNGGETFVVGSDTLITWAGVSPTDTVKLDYSYDDGASWNLITRTATGLKHVWKNVPRPVSAKCLVRVKQQGGSHSSSLEADPIVTCTGHNDPVLSVAFSPDGSLLATTSTDRTAKIWDATTGVLIRTLSGHNGSVSRVDFSPDGDRIATASWDSTAKIWDVGTGALERTLKENSLRIQSVVFSPDGSRIATVDGDRTARIYEVNTGWLLKEFLHTRSLTEVAFDPRGNRIVTASGDGTALIWDANTGLLVRTLSRHYDYVSGVTYSLDGSKIATSSWEGKAAIWDANSGARIRTLAGHTDDVYSVDFSPDGNLVATSSADMSALIWDANTGTIVRRLWQWGTCRFAKFSPDGRRIAAASGDNKARIWDVEGTSIQEDVSDSTFAIVAPASASQDVDMGRCLVGRKRDSLVASFVVNTGTYKFRVDSISIAGAGASQFSLVSGIPPFDVPATGSRPVEFQFAPSSVGIKTAQLLVYTQADTIIQMIRGEGIVPLLEIVNNFIDFGRIKLTEFKDTLQTVTIRNIGAAPISIINSRIAGPNDKDFATLLGGGAFVLAPGASHPMDLRFTANDLGRTSGRLLFDYNDVGSPAAIQLFAEGYLPDTVRTTIAINEVQARAGERIDLVLYVAQEHKLDLLTDPKSYIATIRLNRHVVFLEDQSLACTQIDESTCEIVVKGRKQEGDTLQVLKAIATLGNTDNTELELRSFVWVDTTLPIVVDTRSGWVRVVGVCDEGGVRLYIPGSAKLSLASRPNPASETLRVEYGLVEPSMPILELLDITGVVVSTLRSGVSQQPGQYTVFMDITNLPNGVYFLQLVTQSASLRSRVDVVK